MSNELRCFLMSAVLFVALFVGVLMLAGCAARETRITEYSGKAKPGLVGVPYVSGDLMVNGCRIVQSKSQVAGCVSFKGKGGCSFTSMDCGRNSLDAVKWP